MNAVSPNDRMTDTVLSAKSLGCRDIDPRVQRQLSYARLLAFIERDVLRYSPFYRRVFRERGIRAADLSGYPHFATRVPFTTKRDLQDHAGDFVLQPRWPGVPGSDDVEPITDDYLRTYQARAEQQAQEAGDLEPPVDFSERVRREFLRDWQPMLSTRTGGSTGVSVESSYTYTDLMGPFKRSALFHHNIATWSPTQRFMSLFPAGEHLGFYGNLLVPILSGQPLRPTYGGRVTSTENQILLAQRVRSQAIQGTSSYVTNWLATACAMRNDGRIEGLPNLEIVVVSAEALSEGYRRSIKESLAQLGAGQAKLVQGMSSTELKSGGFRECDEGTGMHVDPQHYFVEIIDPTTQQPAAEAAPGVLVWSHIDWHGNAILRYWSGDIVEGGATFDRCRSCGLVVPRLHPPYRRLESDFLKIRGTRVDLAELRVALELATARDAFQFEISSDAGGVGRHRLIIQVRDDLAARAEAIRKALLDTMDLSIDEIRSCSREEMEQKLYGAGGWKPRWLIHDTTNDSMD